jgi:hypothetical protein
MQSNFPADRNLPTIAVILPPVKATSSRYPASLASDKIGQSD